MNGETRHFLKTSTTEEMINVVFRDDADKNSAIEASFDFELLNEKVAQLKTALKSKNPVNLMEILQNCLARNYADVLNSNVYSVYYNKTVAIIDEFYELLESALKIIYEDKNYLTRHKKMDFFRKCLSSYGNSALLLSGGGALGMIHIGVVHTLLNEDLIPSIIHGASVGSIIASVLCVKSTEELKKMFEEKTFDLVAFDKTSELPNDTSFIRRFYSRLKRFVCTGAIYELETLIRSVQKLIGNVTFKEAFLKTKKTLNITVSSASQYQMPTLLNVISTPDVVIWSAIAASCAVPKIFSPAILLCKKKGTYSHLVPWHATYHENRDGSFELDIPTVPLSELFQVNNFIVSQVNISAVPFIAKSLKMSFLEKIFYQFCGFIKRELCYRLPLVLEFHIVFLIL